LNAHTPKEGKIDSKESFYQEMEQVFDNFLKDHTKILLGDFKAKFGRDDIFKPTIWNDSLHQDSNDNDVRTVNFAT
jgi:exonuclease III